MEMQLQMAYPDLKRLLVRRHVEIGKAGNREYSLLQLRQGLSSPMQVSESELFNLIRNTFALL